MQIPNTPNKKQQLKNALGGLFMMILFTGMWAIVAEAILAGSDYWMGAVIFGALLAFFLYRYYKLNKAFKLLPGADVPESQEEKARSKWFNIILAAEGIAIFLAKNFLINTGHDNLFVPTFALIVGLHFFPLGMLFKRRFDYWAGTWTSLIAIWGLIVIILHYPPARYASAIVCIGCALATSAYAIKMIGDGNRAMTQ